MVTNDNLIMIFIMIFIDDESVVLLVKALSFIQYYLQFCKEYHFLDNCITDSFLSSTMYPYFYSLSSIDKYVS